ncbi:MAG: nucleotidyltransferase [Candidatus Binataceae bacterium]
MVTLSSPLDELLDGICEVLQITATQYDDAVSKYEAVGTWLAAGGSPLEHIADDIFAQGSMALGTTVKPLGQEEFDLDLIFPVKEFAGSPLALYELVDWRIAQNGLYAPILEKRPRCLRLNYANAFHLDIVPARPHRRLGGTYIEIPDRTLASWIPNNPLGFQTWFGSCCKNIILLEKASVLPVPAREPVPVMPPLKRVVQLLKRNRDIVFADQDDEPSSILLTTLAGQHYAKDASVHLALCNVVSGIAEQVRQADPYRIAVMNPPCETQDLCEGLSDRGYKAFANWIWALHQALLKLHDGEGLENVANRLKRLFGERVTLTAVKSFSGNVRKARERGALRAGRDGLSTAVGAGAGIVVPRHDFHGD